MSSESGTSRHQRREEGQRQRSHGAINERILISTFRRCPTPAAADRHERGAYRAGIFPHARAMRATSSGSKPKTPKDSERESSSAHWISLTRRVTIPCFKNRKLGTRVERTSRERDDLSPLGFSDEADENFQRARVRIRTSRCGRATDIGFAGCFYLETIRCVKRDKIALLTQY